MGHSVTVLHERGARSVAGRWVENVAQPGRHLQASKHHTREGHL